MARTRHDEPDEDDPEEDRDWEDSEDYDPDDPETYPAGLYADPEPATIACPHCGAEVLEDSERCPRCEAYISKEETPTSSGPSAWVVVLVLALLAAAMLIGVG